MLGLYSLRLSVLLRQKEHPDSPVVINKNERTCVNRACEGEPRFTLGGFDSPKANEKGVYVIIHPFARPRWVFTQNGKDSFVRDWYHSFRKSIASRYFLAEISL